MSLMTRRGQTYLTWLGLFAMLMVFVGPLVSQSQRMLEHGPPVARSASGHASHHAQSSMAMHDADALAACGYCTLFAHVPGINPTLSLPPSQAIARPHTTLTNTSGVLQHARYFRFSPRAPPRIPRLPLMS